MEDNVTNYTYLNMSKPSIFEYTMSLTCDDRN